MKELKTLKDIKSISKNPMWNMGYATCMEHSKEEAIKWVKELDKVEECPQTKNKKIVKYLIKNGFAASIGDIDEPDCSNLIYWIKHFFNIKEEEIYPQNESSSEK